MSFTAGFKLAWGVAGEPGGTFTPTTPMKNKRCRIRIQRSNNTPSAGMVFPGVHAIADHRKTVSKHIA